MQLNVTTDYAVRAMVCLAEEKRMVSGVEIAEKMNIPPTYLLNIMGKLRNAAFVSVKRGNAGGYVLAKQPSEISLWDIMEVMEGTMKIDRYDEDKDACGNASAGVQQVRDAYRCLQNTMETYLRSVTLDKLAMEDGTS
jgi:Rrf2 family nitric oxide-sensitive transcriptional repressor